MPRIGDRVEILAGMPEFIGKTGTIIDRERHGEYEPPYYRVELDEPVEVELVGQVTDDLWQAQYLKKVG